MIFFLVKWWPSELLASNDTEIKVSEILLNIPTVLRTIHHYSITFVKAKLICNLGSVEHHVSHIFLANISGRIRIFFIQYFEMLFSTSQFLFVIYDTNVIFKVNLVAFPHLTFGKEVQLRFFTISLSKFLDFCWVYLLISISLLARNADYICIFSEFHKKWDLFCVLLLNHLGQSLFQSYWLNFAFKLQKLLFLRRFTIKL